MEINGLFNTIIGLIFGFIAAIYAEPLRIWLHSPILTLLFEENSGCKIFTKEKYIAKESKELTPNFYNSIYVRIKVTNTQTTMAKGCRAYLISIDKSDDKGNFIPTIYNDSIQLSWSCQGDQSYEPLDLPRGVIQYIDIFSTKEGSNIYYPKIKFLPFRYEELFRQKGSFRFTILVAGENFKPLKIKIIFNWTGNWNKFVINSR